MDLIDLFAVFHSRIQVCYPGRVSHKRCVALDFRDPPVCKGGWFSTAGDKITFPQASSLGGERELFQQRISPDCWLLLYFCHLYSLIHAQMHRHFYSSGFSLESAVCFVGCRWQGPCPGQIGTNEEQHHKPAPSEIGYNSLRRHLDNI